MSLLQLKNIHKRHLLWAKLFGFCLFLHFIFLFWAFCVYRDNSYMLSLSIDKKLDYSTPIFFVPLGIPTVQQPVATTKTIAPKKTVPATPPIKNPEKKQATTVAAKPNTQNNSPKVEPQKPQTVATPAPPKKSEPTKPETQKQEVKKPEDIKKEIAQPKPTPAKPVASAPAIKQALDIEQTITPVIPENAQISHNYREVEALRKQAQLQKEIVQKWQPPIGVSPDCMCEVSFFINATGKIENIKMIKSSGVMMFDISVRQALFAMKMPQWTYGKPFTISFKSSSA